MISDLKPLQNNLLEATDYCVSCIRVVFSVTTQQEWKHFTTHHPQPNYMAYVEWYTPFTMPERHHRQYKVRLLWVEGGVSTSIVDVSDVVSSIRLLPKFGPVCNRDWTSSNVLDHCDTFYVNSFGNYNRGIYNILVNGYFRPHLGISIHH
jgi:hypothetical protein